MKKQKIAVIGSGITGLSCAWWLSRFHDVTLFEKDDRFGGHSNTVDVQGVPVDTGFIVFNERCYPNLVQLFKQLGVQTQPTTMSFSVSMQLANQHGALEYAGTNLAGLFAQPSLAFKPAYWRMLRDILRFYKEADWWRQSLPEEVTLGMLLQQGKYGEWFRDAHLIPMGAAIWSTPAAKMLDYPAQTFLRFCENHGLLQLKDRPQWHTVVGGSRSYVQAILQQLGDTARCNRGVRRVRRLPGKVLVEDWQGDQWHFDQVVMACHADQSLQLLEDVTLEERQVLAPFKYERNLAILHSDSRLMPKRQKAWASWNYLGQGQGEEAKVAVTYWMNALQHLPSHEPLLVTLNPPEEPRRVHASFLYDHPLFDRHALRAQPRLWDVQGLHRTWFCGAWCGYGFHEDGLQAGLAVAEAISGQQRPWAHRPEQDRIQLPADWHQRFVEHAA
ncbi:NAD(P)/FAD-dependent oxidoreductase [Balneatrix alpica]|uniref:NAD(P)/FAD-dependent oxidoreductase n=1 Tax=Balneatrix alpica TaxID=75684 RepID=A0ABV5Z9X3_9GAMM|nr:FAD-dependent oxidoreductase [Balneatrix alpica]